MKCTITLLSYCCGLMRMSFDDEMRFTKYTSSVNEDNKMKLSINSTTEMWWLFYKDDRI